MKFYSCCYFQKNGHPIVSYFRFNLTYHFVSQGQRLDKFQRPELCLGTYECLATTDYCRDSKPPQPPGIIFAIDVSYPMIKEGVVQLICANMKKMLRENLPRDKDCDQVCYKLLLTVSETIGSIGHHNSVSLFRLRKYVRNLIHT